MMSKKSMLGVCGVLIGMVSGASMALTAQQAAAQRAIQPSPAQLLATQLTQQANNLANYLRQTSVDLKFNQNAYKSGATPQQYLAAAEQGRKTIFQLMDRGLYQGDPALQRAWQYVNEMETAGQALASSMAQQSAIAKAQAASAAAHAAAQAAALKRGMTSYTLYNHNFCKRGATWTMCM